MENRFGLKDLVVVALLLAIVISIWVAIFGYDRQHRTTLRTIEERQQAQQEQLGQLTTLLRETRREHEHYNPVIVEALAWLIEHLDDEPAEAATPDEVDEVVDQPEEPDEEPDGSEAEPTEQTSQTSEAPAVNGAGARKSRDEVLAALRRSPPDDSRTDIESESLLNGDRRTGGANDREQVLESLRWALEHQPGTEDDLVPAFERRREAQSAPDYATGDWVVEAFSANLPNLTPVVSTDIYQRWVEAHVIEPLAVRHPDTLEFEPVLARSWEIDDNTEQWQAFVDQHLGQPITEEQIREEPEFRMLDDEQQEQEYIERRLEEGLRVENIVEMDEAPHAATYTFFLRDDVEFSDGEPFTSEDVVFTFELIMNPEVEAPRMRSYLRRFDGIEALDEYTVRFTASEPYFLAMSQAAGLMIVPKHYYSQFSPSQINREPALLMGSGPYRLRRLGQWSPGQDIELVRNERYWAEYPTFNRLVFRPITNDTARMVAFRNAEIDTFIPTPEQHDEMMRSTEINERADGYAYAAPGSGYTYIGWKQEDDQGNPTLFADKRVRQAMTLLTPRERISEEVYYGLHSPATGPFDAMTGQADPDIEPWPYDPERAMELLAEAGFELDASGVLRDADGEAFSFELTFPARTETYEDAFYFMQDSFARAGIEIRPNPQDWSIFRDLLNNRDFEAITKGWGGGIESDPYQIFHSSQIDGLGDNYVRFRNDELDELIMKARGTLDPEQRMPLWNRVHEILHEEQPYTFMMSRQSMRWVDKRFRNVQIFHLGMNDRQEWYVPRDEQRWME